MSALDRRKKTSGKDASPEVSEPEAAGEDFETQETPASAGETGADAAAGGSGAMVDVHPLQYAAFDGDPDAQTPKNSMELVYDIPLQVTVEIGKAFKEISEILEFGLGTIIVLDKLAGDPVEVLANGKLIARGEVVVIDENYGVRVTEIINGK
ncbi:MAG: flagellar motor switch protein FliN [Oscillospiraceae bacterium]|nr:flagellar motor switch protein FliN [Oscillospiraceae bacterium]